HLALGGGSEGVGEDAFLAAVLGGGGRGIGEGGAVAAAEQVGAGPGAHGEGPLAEHGAEDGAQQGLSGLAVAARVGQARGLGGFGECRVVQAGGGGEVDVGAVCAEGGGRVEGAGQQGAADGRGLGGGDVDDDGAGEVVAADEVADVGGEYLDPVVLGTDGPGSLSPSRSEERRVGRE